MTGSVLTSAAELQDFVNDHRQVHVIGRGSKPALHHTEADTGVADVTAICGITEYQPQEFTLTVRAGTLVRDLKAELRQQGQYLPFDPLFADKATIGGTVACNLSGSRRFRYGGIRDFVLGAQVVDGLGRAFSVGGKVVKNAAGFDLAKFMVGSMGKFAIMTELTFKVFPDVPRFRALKLMYRSLDDTLAAVFYCNQSTHELDALDFAPAGDGWSLLASLAGFSETLPQRTKQFVSTLREHTALLDVFESDDMAEMHDPLAALSGEFLVKVVLSPRQICAFDASIGELPRRYSVGGNIAWVAGDNIRTIENALTREDLTGLVLRGQVDNAIIGKPLENDLAARVKQVLDPHNKLV